MHTISEDSSSTRVLRRVLLIRCAPSFRTRRYFSRHSNKDNSLQEYSSFAGETIGTRIDKYRPLVMSLRFVRQLRNNTAQSLVLFRQARRSYSRRLAARTSNKHIPFISTPWISVRFFRLRRWRTHQADNLAKLRQEFLSLLELIAKIFCAVVIAKTSEALGNTPLRFAFLFRGFPRLRSEWHLRRVAVAYA